MEAPCIQLAHCLFLHEAGALSRQSAFSTSDGVWFVCCCLWRCWSRRSPLHAIWPGRVAGFRSRQAAGGRISLCVFRTPPWVLNLGSCFCRRSETLRSKNGQGGRWSQDSRCLLSQQVMQRHLHQYPVRYRYFSDRSQVQTSAGSVSTRRQNKPSSHRCRASHASFNGQAKNKE